MEALALVLFLAVVIALGIFIANRKRGSGGVQRPGKARGPIRDRLED